MSNPRVIIACKDQDYIFPIKQRFIEQYSDSVDLEIITDEEYFKALFAGQQRASLLVVDESLFNDAVKLHSIDNVCVLAETEDAENEDNGNISRVYKYSSIKEVFKRISSSLNVNSDSADNITKVVTVTSASGGTGKTTIAFGIATALEGSGFSTLYIDAEWLQTFQWRLHDKNSISDVRAYTILSGDKGDKYQAIKHFIRKERFSYLPSFRDPMISQGLDNSIFIDIVKSAQDSGEYDCILIDTDHVFDATKAKLLEMSDYVVIVTEQTGDSIQASNNLANNIDGASTEKYVFVCNKFDEAISSGADSVQPKYHINEHVGYKMHMNQMTISDWGEQEEIQRIAYLIS